jgi:hypothetical protein
MLNNQPNPFTESTTIYYTISKASDVEIAVFDWAGRKLTNYKYKSQAAGAYTIAIDKAKLTQAGLYYYTLYVDGKMMASKKMIKLR